MAEVLQLIVLLRNIEPVGTTLTVELKVPFASLFFLLFSFQLYTTIHSYATTFVTACKVSRST